MLEFLVLATVGLNVWADFMDRRAAGRSDPSALSLWTTIVQFILVMPLIGLVSQPTTTEIIICACVGAFTALSRIPWYRALSTPGQSLSRLTPFTRLSSVLVLILAVTLLGEEVSMQKFLGALLMVAGALAVSLQHSFTSLKDYVVTNKAIALVLIFACSLAATSVFYKYMMNAGVALITTYFLLKFFQCASAIAYNTYRGTLFNSFLAISDLQLFVRARTLQTAAAFLYLFVLRNLDLSTVEPIAAAAGPALYFLIDQVQARRAPRQASADARPPIIGQALTIFGLFASAAGLYLVVGGR